MTNEEIYDKEIAITVKKAIPENNGEAIKGNPDGILKDGKIYKGHYVETENGKKDMVFSRATYGSDGKLRLLSDEEIAKEDAQIVENKAAKAGSYEKHEGYYSKDGQNFIYKNGEFVRAKVINNQPREMTEAELAKEQPSKYVIQLGERYDDLIKRSLKSLHEGEEGYTPSKEEIDAAKAQFKAENPKAFTKNGKYLLAGAEVNIRGSLTYADDAKTVRQKVTEHINKQAEIKRQKAEEQQKAEEAAKKQEEAKKEKENQNIYNERYVYAIQHGYQKTDNDQYISLDKNGKKEFYKWNPDKKHFMLKEGVTDVYKNGDYRHVIKNGTGNKGRVHYSSKGAEQYRCIADSDKSNYSMDQAAKVCGLENTFASKDGYYKVTGKNGKVTHYKYDKNTKRFYPVSGIKTVRKDGFLTPENTTKGVADAAKQCGLDKTAASTQGFYVDRRQNPPRHYVWNKKGKQFVPMYNVKTISSNGSIIVQTTNVGAAAKDAKLSPTGNKNYFYNSYTGKYYEWNKKTKTFEIRNDVKAVGADGSIRKY